MNDAVYNCPEGGGARHDKIDKSLKSQSDGSFRERQRLCGFNVDRAKERTRLYVWRQTPANIIPTEYAALKNSKAMLIDGDYDVSGD